jgi:hypothetical protein
LEQLEQVDLQQMVSQAKGLKALTQFLVLSHQLAEAMAEVAEVYQMYLQVVLVDQVAVADVLISA